MQESGHESLQGKSSKELLNYLRTAMTDHNKMDVDLICLVAEELQKRGVGIPSQDPKAAFLQFQKDYLPGD